MIYGERRAIIRAMVVMSLLCASASALAQASRASIRVEGTVADQSGAPISDAEVVLKSGVFTSTRFTDAQGGFAFDPVPSASGTLTVRARGFATASRAWSVQASEAARLEIRLEPGALSEQVTVTAERTATRLSETAASVVVISSEELEATAALTLDDALRQIPGFSLFRRSGSRTANPTSQGVSLRGVGASGASRAAVLADGIPLNDPFGGWVYWGRFPRELVGRMEVVRGGSSHLYGTDALGGVINVIPRETSNGAVLFEGSVGNQTTVDGSLYAGGRLGQIGAQLSGEILHTDGYPIVDERERGLVDTPAGARHQTLELTLERFFPDAGRVFARGSVFGEQRENGTPLQTNQTYIRQAAAGADWQSARLGTLSMRAYASTQIFDQDFSAVAAGRNSESLTRSQRVPAQQIGFTSQWSRVAGSRQTIVAGLDAREVRGASDELVFVGGRLTSAVGAGGRARTIGVFGQDIIRITSRLLATIGARVDRWRNYDALSTTTPLAQPGPTSVSAFADRDETAFSPRLSLLYKLAENLSITASGYRAFRAPTLNELYRSFRVGNVITSANPDLLAERLTGGEGGAIFNAFDRRLNMRGTFFWSEITRPIANVTTGVAGPPPVTIFRQRQNLGRTRSRGVEIEAEARLTTAIGVSGGYQFVDAVVSRFPSASIEGNLIPQVPRHQLTFQARYSRPSSLTVGLQGRAVGSQFDDDQNQFLLERFFTLDALASFNVARGMELFGAFENLLDKRYSVGRTPLRTIGPPALFRFGYRLRLGGR